MFRLKKTFEPFLIKLLTLLHYNQIKKRHTFIKPIIDTDMGDIRPICLTTLNYQVTENEVICVGVVLYHIISHNRSLLKHSNNCCMKDSIDL